jgi:hypothetical protein
MRDDILIVQIRPGLENSQCSHPKKRSGEREHPARRAVYDTDRFKAAETRSRHLARRAVNDDRPAVTL